MTTSGDLNLDVTQQGRASVVRLAGAVGMAEASMLGQQLQQLLSQPAMLVVVDMEHLDFLCSSGLGALIDAHASAREHDCEVRLAGPSAMVRRLLETTRLTNLFCVYPNVDEAIKS